MTSARVRAREAVEDITCWRAMDDQECGCCGENNDKANAASDIWEPLLREAYAVICNAMFRDGMHPEDALPGSAVANIREALAP